MMSIFAFLIPGALLGTIPVIMPNWRAWFICLLIIGTPIIGLWLHHFYISSDPNYTPSVGDTLGIIGFTVFTFVIYVGFAIGAWRCALKMPPNPKYEHYFDPDS